MIMDTELAGTVVEGVESFGKTALENPILANRLHL